MRQRGMVCDRRKLAAAGSLRESQGLPAGEEGGGGRKRAGDAGIPLRAQRFATPFHRACAHMQTLTHTCTGLKDKMSGPVMVRVRLKPRNLEPKQG